MHLMIFKVTNTTMFFIELQTKGPCELKTFADSTLSKDLTGFDLLPLVKKRQVFFDGKPVNFLPFKVFKKGKLQVFLDDKSYVLKPTDVIYEDEQIIAINKPSGLSSQASLKPLQEHAHSSVMCYLFEKLKRKTLPTLFLLHRLDVDTSGVLLFSKKASANKSLQNSFEKKLAVKTYYAISESESKVPKKVITHLGRSPDSTHSFKFASVDKDNPGAKFSETHFEETASFSDFKLICAKPRTGRSHQIRVHLKESGLPIKGDVFYNQGDKPPLFLHARRLKINHPRNEKPLTLEAPFPGHWNEFLKRISRQI